MGEEVFESKFREAYDVEQQQYRNPCVSQEHIDWEVNEELSKIYQGKPDGCKLLVVQLPCRILARWLTDLRDCGMQNAALGSGPSLVELILISL
jgi:hypothetical protein